MSAILLMLIALAIFIVAYITYGSFLAKKLGVDPKNKTPAHTMRDDVDYVPTRAPVLLGHHFASIAGAGPIIGPIVAGVFGWLPVFLWVVFGNIFVGAVKDFQTLVASLRHRSKTISEILKENVGVSSKKLLAALLWLALILIIAVFAVVVARTFVGFPSAATASVLFIPLAIVFGYAVYRRGVPLAAASVIGVAVLALAVWLGIMFPLRLPETVWVIVLLGYSVVAASLPVWFLLQPRDYLNSFMLYALLGSAVVGIFAANPTIQLPVFTSFETGLGYLFPILFVTVACGAISGFHSIVASGTTSKQLSNEAHAKPIGYGSMLIEGVLAVVALSAIAVLTLGEYTDLLRAVGPVGAFSAGVGGFLTALGIPLEVGRSFAALAVSAFVLTTLDTAARLCRFTFQELLEPEKEGVKAPTIVNIATNRWVASGIGVVLGGILALTGVWTLIWPIFGSANQLVGALALLAGSVWLARLGKSNWFVFYPMIFMLAVTMSALVVMFFRTLAAGQWLLVIISAALFILAIILVYLAVTKLIVIRRQKALGEVPGK
jgi:carbon starvation protein